MFKITLRIRAMCPKHKRYNPVRDGLAFRSSCKGCEDAHHLYQKTMELRRLMPAVETKK